MWLRSLRSQSCPTSGHPAPCITWSVCDSPRELVVTGNVFQWRVSPNAIHVCSQCSSLMLLIQQLPSTTPRGFCSLECFYWEQNVETPSSKHGFDILKTSAFSKSHVIFYLKHAQVVVHFWLCFICICCCFISVNLLILNKNYPSFTVMCMNAMMYLENLYGIEVFVSTGDYFNRGQPCVWDMEEPPSSCLHGVFLLQRDQCGRIPERGQANGHSDWTLHI